MPAVQRFPRRDHRGRLRPGLLLTPERLSIWHGRKRRHLLWSEVLCARWLDRQHAELVLLGDERVPLGPIESLEEAVAAIDQRVERARTAAASADSVPSVLARRLLRPRPVTWPELVVGALLVAWLAFAVASLPPEPGKFDPRPWRWWLTLAGATAGAAMVWKLRSGSGAVDATGFVAGKQRYAWHEIHRLVEANPVLTHTIFRGYHVHLETTGGLVKTSLNTRADMELLCQYLAEREQWRSTDHIPAGPLPPPDNALSLARETGQDGIDRGLSLTVNARGHS